MLSVLYFGLFVVVESSYPYIIEALIPKNVKARKTYFAPPQLPLQLFSESLRKNIDR
jgi:hypothetical protein